MNTKRINLFHDNVSWFTLYEYIIVNDSSITLSICLVVTSCYEYYRGSLRKLLVLLSSQLKWLQSCKCCASQFKAALATIFIRKIFVFESWRKTLIFHKICNFKTDASYLKKVSVGMHQNRVSIHICLQANNNFIE